MKQEAPGISAAELTEPQLTQVTGGMTTEQLRALANDTREQGIEYGRGVTKHSEVSIIARSANAGVANLVDFPLFLGGQIAANQVDGK